MGNLTIYRTAADTNEAVVHAGRVRLHRVIPEENAMTGNFTIRNAKATGTSDVVHICAANLPAAGKDFGGAVLEVGMTVQKSDASARVAVVYEPF